MGDIDGVTTRDLTRFALAVLKEFHGDGERGDIDGGWLQETGIQCGVILREHRVTPCGPACPCSEFIGLDEPVVCTPIRADVFRAMLTPPDATGAGA